MNINCTVCNHDLTNGIVLLTKSPSLYAEKFRYVHCQECGRTFLVDLSGIKVEEVNYSAEGVEEDIVQSLSSVLGSLQEEILNMTEDECSCGESCDCDGTCQHHNCKH